MEGKKYLLGEVSEITGIHKDTLRFYDKIGLLKPRYVNPDNKYRYYTYDQFWSLDIITCCRSLNIPIKTIKAILASSSNDMVMELLHEHQRTALRLCAYYRKISEDIDWYMEQYEMIKHTNAKPRVTIKSLPPRQTLYGENPDDTHAYPLNLQKLCRKAMKQSDFIRRNYGFILDETKIFDDEFVKKGEYISFEENEFENVEPKYLCSIPGGKYACFIVNVVSGRADFHVLTEWLEERDIRPRYVIADEIGLQLFEYLDRGYLCEVKVLLE